MRTIDADRLLTDRAKGTYYHLPNGDTAIPIIDIEHAPTIDAVEVVRCKDCVHYYVGYPYDCCSMTDKAAEENDFCSWAERKKRWGTS